MTNDVKVVDVSQLETIPVSALQSGHLVNPLHYMDHFTRCQVPNKNQSEREISFHFIYFITCLKCNQVLLLYFSHREMVWNLIRAVDVNQNQ